MLRKPLLSTALTLSIQPSKLLWGWLGLFSMLVVFSCLMTLPSEWAAGVCGLYGFSVGHWLKRHGGASRIVNIEVTVYGELWLTNRQQQRFQVMLLGASAVYTHCVVLQYCIVTSHLSPTKRWQRIIGGRQTLLILPDQTDELALRGFRRWLRWGLQTTAY